MIPNLVRAASQTFLLISMLSAQIYSQICSSACEAPEQCDQNSDPRGTCCCPYPPEAYPLFDTDEYHELCSYKLSPEQEAKFAVGDGLSPFWSVWNDDDIFDHIHLSPDYSGNTWNRSAFGFTSESDCRMTVRTAWGSNGLYLYCEISDDNWSATPPLCIYSRDRDASFCPDDPGFLNWANDALDLYFDPFPTSVHQVLPDEVFYDPSLDRRTKQMLNLLCRFGAEEPPESLTVIKMNDSTEGMPRLDVRIEHLPDQLDGMAVDFVAISENTRIQEWFIPWSLIGRTPDPQSQMPEFAFACGYNDFEEGQEGYDALLWRNAANPFKRVQDWSTGQSAFLPTEPWGDIRVLNEELPPPSAAPPSQNGPTPNTAWSTVEYFDLLGRSIAKFDLSRKSTTSIRLETVGSMLLEKAVTRSGTVHTRSIVVQESGVVVNSN